MGDTVTLATRSYWVSGSMGPRFGPDAVEERNSFCTYRESTQDSHFKVDSDLLWTSAIVKHHQINRHHMSTICEDVLTFCKE